MNKERLQNYNDRLTENNISLETIKEKINELPTIPETTQLEIIPTKEGQVFEGLYDNVTVEPIPDNYIEPSGTLDITENGTYDVTDYQTVNTGIYEQTPYAPRLMSFANYTGTELDYEVKNLDTTNLTSTKDLFYYCSNLQRLDVSHFNTKNVTNMSQMFSRCQNVPELDVSNFNTSNVVNMDSMFFYMKKLKSLDLSNFDTSKVNSMASMFAYMDIMEELNISSFDTSNVTNMANMFNYSPKIKEFNLSHFDTSKVTNMSYMFQGSNATKFDLSSFNTSNVTRMDYMFYAMRGADTLDLSNFDFSNVTNMDRMFYMSYIKHLDLGDSSAGKVNNVGGAFQYVSFQTIKFFNDLGKGYTSKSANNYNYKLDLSYAPLDYESAIDIINKVYDLNLTYDVANGGALYTQTIDLHSNALKTLTPEEISIATNKGWSVL